MGTQATASTKGYLLQDYFGIYFFFENKNYKNISSIKLEGKKEDIEIIYKDKSQDYIQVKTREKPSLNLNFDSQKFKKAVNTLYNALEKAQEENIQVNRLILANNMFNQGFERLNKQIQKGDEVNFIYGIDQFTKEEIDIFSKKVNHIIDKNFFIARIDESYFLNKTKILKELDLFFSKLKITSDSSIIYEELKTLFRENSTSRDIYLKKEDIAWIFIKRIFNSERVNENFENNFSEELDEIYYSSIDEFLDERNLLKLIERNIDCYKIYLHYEKIKRNFVIRYGKIVKDNLKDFINKGAKEFIKENYLCLDTENFNDKESLISYQYLFWCLHKKKNKSKRIYEEFEIGE